MTINFLIFTNHFLMHKLESLEQVHASIEPVRQKRLRELLYSPLEPAQREHLLREVGELSLLQEEVVAHRRALELADIACAQGLAGTVPDRWDEVMGGEVYSAYRELLYALDIAPGGQLSPALLTYIDQLPSRSSQEYLDRIIESRSPATVWPGNPLKDLTDEQVGQQSHKILTEQLEATLFAGSYAADLAQARQLAEARADFGSMRELLA
jgi:hypothetical protein